MFLLRKLHSETTRCITEIKGAIDRIVKEKKRQSESLVRIRTSSSPPMKGDPSWVESFVRSTRCLSIFASRGEVQCRLPILRSYPLVPRRELVPLLLLFFFIYLSFVFDMSNKPLNRSQTRRPDPFRLSAVTTRGLCLYSSGDCISPISGIFDIQSQRNTKTITGPP